MSKAQLPLLTSVIMLGQAFLSAPAGLRAKRSIADRNQVLHPEAHTCPSCGAAPCTVVAVHRQSQPHAWHAATGLLQLASPRHLSRPGLCAVCGLNVVLCFGGGAQSNDGLIKTSRVATAASQVLLVGFAAMIAADLIFALVPSVYGARTPSPELTSCLPGPR